MYRLCNINLEDSKKIFEKLNRFIQRLKHKHAVREVYLYGSFAKGEIHEGSDIDLVVIGDFNGRIFERIESILKLTDLPVEPLPYTPEEFKRMKKNPFIRKISKTWRKL